MTQVTAKKSYIKDADGNYIVPFVNPADNDNLGVVKADGSTITSNTGILTAPLATKDFINNSKALETGGLSNNADIYADVLKYAHSTFDLSKFTKTGTDIITNDGILTHSTMSNYLEPNGITIDNVSKYRVYASFTTGSTLESGGAIFKADPNGFSVYCGSTGTIRFQYRTSDNTEVEVNNFRSYANSSYDVFMEIDFTTKQITTGYKSSSEATYTETTTTASSLYTYSGGFIFYNAKEALTADLKNVLILKNGIPVFSGNKTGIDTIKDNDYTVVGTPTISNDGILSNTTNNDYCSVPITTISSMTTGAWRIDFAGKFPSNETVKCYAVLCASNGINIGNLNANNYYYLQVFDSTSTAHNLRLDNYLDSTKFNKNFIGYATFDGVQTYTLALSVDNGITWTIGTMTDSATVYFSSETMRMGSGQTTLSTATYDLNGYRFYVNGNLIYQPCLKIPYTLSKSGSKVVDSVYRDRVNDMATQFGYAPYYTLQEEIKTDYTVVGSPTISSDYVASGFSASNYVDITHVFDSSTTYTSVGFSLGFEYTKATPEWLGELRTSDNNNRITLQANSTYDKLTFSVNAQGTTYSLAQAQSTLTLTQNHKYSIQVVVNSTTATAYLHDLTTNETKTQSITAALPTLNQNTIIHIGKAYASSSYYGGSIDLKYVNAYVNNKLVYEAVINPNFTLPQTEIYGNIQRTLRDSYRNGATYWELWSDRTLEIGGTCTSGVEYNLPKNFASATDYIVTIPYSAKTASSFTPTASGDFIAKGLGVL